MPPSDTPVAPTIDHVSKQIQAEIDAADEAIGEKDNEIAAHKQELSDAYARLLRDVAAKGADADKLFKAHTEYVMKHEVKLQRLLEELKVLKAQKQQIVARKNALLSQLNDPDAS